MQICIKKMPRYIPLGWVNWQIKRPHNKSQYLKNLDTDRVLIIAFCYPQIEFQFLIV